MHLKERPAFSDDLPRVHRRYIGNEWVNVWVDGWVRAWVDEGISGWADG